MSHREGMDAPSPPVGEGWGEGESNARHDQPEKRIAMGAAQVDVTIRLRLLPASSATRVALYGMFNGTVEHTFGDNTSCPKRPR